MKRLGISIFLAIVISLIIFFTLNDFGISWDEPIHFRNADMYVAWIKHPVWGNKDQFFKATEDDVHPPFRKLVAGLTHEITTNTLRVMDNTRGYRISALLFIFPFVATLTYIAIGRFGYAVGLLVPLMFSFLPHVLYLTTLVTMDYAIAGLWFLAVVTGIKGAKDYRWLTASGIFMGLTMLTKLHGFLLFVPIVGYLVWQKAHISRMVYVVIVALVVYGIGWPWLWSSPVAHIREYFNIQTAHGSVPVLLFGKTYAFAPWWYTPLMFLTTTPAFVLLFFFFGTYWSVRKGTRWDHVMLANALYPMVFFSLPGVYRYDWVRLFLASFPFVCLLAGGGVFVAMKLLHKRLRIWGYLAIYALWGLTLFYSVVRIHPWESSYYNEFVGGISGARTLGFETEYWGNAYLGILPWMNDHKKDPMCVTPTTHPFYYYQAMGQLDAGVVYRAPKEDCHFVVVLMRQGLFVRDPFIASVVRTHKPIHAVSVDGVPLVAVYDITKNKD